MKLLRFFLLILVVSCKENPKRNIVPTANRKLTFSNALFKKDSGYITKRDAFSIITNLFKDSISSSYNQLADEDTVGKYYTSTLTGNTIACVIDPVEEFYGRAHILIEIQHTAGKDSIIANERFLHYNYPCCWQNNYDGFKKEGNYFYFKVCGTGSGHCSSALYLFKNIIPQANQNDIAKTINSQYGDEFQNLTSEMEVRDQAVKMNYTLETNFYNKSVKHNIHIIKKFIVNYTLQHNRWVADDSTNLRDLEY